MSLKVPSRTLSEHLRRLHLFTQYAEEKIRAAIQKTEQMGTEAEEVGGIDLKEWADSYADLLITIRLVVLNNQELQTIFEASLANKVANAIVMAENWELLSQVDYCLIAAGISQVRDRATMVAAITEIARRGGEGASRLEWLAKALEREGY
jgi:hypothetical protein